MREEWRNSQPIKLTIVRELEDELVNHAVDADGSTHKLKVSVCRVVEDEVVAVEDAQVVSPDATSELSNY
jgi:hypothetical protein